MQIEGGGRALMRIKRKTLADQRRDAELGLIIDEMGRAMWNAEKDYIARTTGPLTLNMNLALRKFQDYCVKYYGKKV
jgi:hypothetical protein